MYVTYFDEVKANPQQGQSCYWVGGISLPMDAITAVEARLNKLAMDVFGSIELIPETEFHCCDLYHAKRHFKGMRAPDRIGLLVELVGILREFEVIKRIMSVIEVPRLISPKDVPETAFAFFCERVQMLLKALDQTTILIGDHDNEQVKATIRDFARYRADKTKWAYGIKIDRIVDTVHFAHSHHSRMVQLADVYLFYLTHLCSEPPCRNGWMADKLRENLKGMGLYPHRYKIWPKKAP